MTGSDMDCVNMKLGEILMASGLLDGDRLESALAEHKKSGERTGSVLVRAGHISPKDLVSALAEQSGLRAMDGEFPRTPLPGLAGTQPQASFLRHHAVVPIGLEGARLKVASATPDDPFPLEAISVFTGLDVEPVISSPQDILSAIEAVYLAPRQTMEGIIEGIGEGHESPETDNVEELKDMALEAPIINLVNLLISKAAEKRASDIHIEPFESALHVRYRIDGVLTHAETIPPKLKLAIASRIKIMAKLNIAERRLPQDGRIKTNAGGSELDIRVSTIPTLYGESVVMRLLDPAGSIGLEEIGMEQNQRGAFSGLISQPYGMLLVTGPTGSGKSTTLYSALKKIDTREKKVITIEDPVEYNLDGVNQIQVKPKIGFTFANGLRSIVRQDPDVIMVGEIRDAETADIAVHAALTGHLILSTLHTNDAPGALTRLMDMGVESYLLSSSLLGVLAQRLVRRICPLCRFNYSPDEESLKGLKAELERVSGKGGLELYRGAGCAGCDDTGYRGRTGIFELMPISEELRRMISEKKGSNELRAKAISEGMMTLREDGLRKALSGVTTVEEVLRVTLEE